MSLHLSPQIDQAGGFPRVSGDEPLRYLRWDEGIWFSPRERG